VLFCRPQHFPYIIKYVKNAAEQERVAGAYALGDWLEAVVSREGLKEDALEWAPAVDACFSPGAAVARGASHLPLPCPLPKIICGGDDEECQPIFEFIAALWVRM
jgi:hypothetical protein